MGVDAPDPSRPKRTRICLSCRTLLDEGENCAGQAHHTVSLFHPQGRAQMEDEVWGPDSRARQMRQATRVGVGGAGAGGIFQACDLSLDACNSAEGALVALAIIVFALAAIILYYIIRAIVRFIRAKMDRPKPQGALLAAPKPQSNVVAARGVVAKGHPLATPWKAGHAFAYAMELFEHHVFGGGAMLRDAATAGFDVTLEDGRLLRIPPGRVRIVGGLRNVDVDRARMESLLEELDPLSDSTSRKLFPFDRVRAATIAPGDHVEVLGEVTTAVNDDAAGYRSAAFVVAPVGVPVLRVRTAAESVRTRVDVGSGAPEQQEAIALEEAEEGEPSAGHKAAR